MSGAIDILGETEKRVCYKGSLMKEITASRKSEAPLRAARCSRAGMTCRGSTKHVAQERLEIPALYTAATNVPGDFRWTTLIRQLFPTIPKSEEFFHFDIDYTLLKDFRIRCFRLLPRG